MSDVPAPNDSSPQAPQVIDRFDVLSNRTVRRVLSILRGQQEGVPLADLATILASEEIGVPLHEVTAAQRLDARTRLHHHVLPKLESVSLIAVDDDRIRIPASSTLATAPLSTAFELSADDATTDTVFDLLADEKRLTILRTLHPFGEVTVSSLAARLAAAHDVSEADARVSLHHKHLPKLVEAGAIEYDPEADTVTYDGLGVDNAWLDRVLTVQTARDGGKTDADSDVWTIEGRKNVVARGQELFDCADDELFLMVTTDGLLEPECVEKLHDAIDRGVDVYLGSQTSEVRDFVRETEPSVTIWEPQLDWLNLPPAEDTLGRLVMADREAVMLGTLGAEGPEETPREQALTGDGRANPLVILLRETLGSRLDHLDGQSEDVLSHLPL